MKNTPKIFEAYHYGEEIPQGLNAVTVKLDAQMNSDLNWSRAIEAARYYIADGFDVLWDIDFGLFDRLSYPLGAETQFLSFGLAIDHFIDKIWDPFQDHTVGVNICRTSLDFTKGFPWDAEQVKNLQEWLKITVGDVDDLNAEIGSHLTNLDAVTQEGLVVSEKGIKVLRLFCRDACSEYLSFLGDRFPNEIEILSFFDAEGITDPTHLMQLISKERFERIKMAVRGGVLPIQDYAWGQGISPNGCISRIPLKGYERESVKIGVCVPEHIQWKLSQFADFEKPLLEMNELKLLYRLIPESQITYDWDGLDYLIVSPQLITTLGTRKLLGFCAAGGTILTLGEKMGLPMEESFSIDLIR